MALLSPCHDVYSALVAAYHEDFDLPTAEPVPPPYAQAFLAIAKAVYAADDPVHDLESLSSILETAVERMRAREQRS